VNNTVFTFVNAVLIRGLPFEQSDRIMYLDMRLLTRNQPRPVSYPDYLDWKTQTQTFSDLGAFSGGTMNVSDAGHPPERIQGNFVTANTFGSSGSRRSSAVTSGRRRIAREPSRS
jgi:putative ABC transport system permease protein